MRQQKKLAIASRFENELKIFERLENASDRWNQLERLHIIAQSNITFHYKTHLMMLRLAIKESNLWEVLGQLLRLVLVAPGHLLGTLPRGNVGTTRVSAFKPMKLPSDLDDLLK